MTVEQRPLERAQQRQKQSDKLWKGMNGAAQKMAYVRLCKRLGKSDESAQLYTRLANTWDAVHNLRVGTKAIRLDEKGQKGVKK